MNIIGTKPFINNLQIVYVTTTVDGDLLEAEIVVDLGLTGQKLQDDVDAKAEQLHLHIKQKMYQGYDGSDLTQWKLDNPNVVKVPYTGNHDGLYDRQINGSRIKQITLDVIEAKATLAGPEVLAFWIELKKILVSNPNVVNPNA